MGEVVTEGPWAGWEVVGWRASSPIAQEPEFWLAIDSECGDFAASVRADGWRVFAPGVSSKPLAQGNASGEAGRLAAEAALRAIGVPVGEITPAPDSSPDAATYRRAEARERRGVADGR